VTNAAANLINNAANGCISFTDWKSYNDVEISQYVLRDAAYENFIFSIRTLLSLLFFSILSLAIHIFLKNKPLINKYFPLPSIFLSSAIFQFVIILTVWRYWKYFITVEEINYLNAQRFFHLLILNKWLSVLLMIILFVLVNWLAIHAFHKIENKYFGEKKVSIFQIILFDVFLFGLIIFGNNYSIKKIRVYTFDRVMVKCADYFLNGPKRFNDPNLLGE
jgi:hypothetical protein